MGKFVLLFTFLCYFDLLCFEEKVLSLLSIMKCVYFFYFSPFAFVVFLERNFYLCSSLCNMGTFVLLFTFCFCRVSKVFYLFDVIKWTNLCYFSPFVFVVFRRKKFYLCLTLCKMATSAQCASPQYCQCDKIKGKYKKKGQC